MTRTILVLLLVLLAAALNPTLAQQGAPPFTTDNSQSACVEFGSCSTAGGNGIVTETQNAPVTAPAFTPALATVTTIDSAYISSLAAAGASAAYTGGSRQSAGALTSTRTVTGSGSGSTGSSGSGSGSSGSGSSGSSGSGSSNAGKGANAVAVQMVVACVGVVIGAAVLL
ncbi:hypothetical protein PSEUBRA_003179 [Kalmanozyma brasiliensis GHG001]|uniref:uncharacterized protein n=1 Tax=Kalmanozyma brasiliensis (strain GHG001) TaxID=1365824 RepID=UPI001CE988A1|nr:uncharacterized protein PSEUBRA_003179 [Kalmanozyma brasiliensis GHG001]KAF6767196.1 hypothetical protein PSEUBRA_003179 [Kalmanozyma brasiliensis GHG001]